MIAKNKITFSNVVLVLIVLALAWQLALALLNYAHQVQLALSFIYPIDYGEGPLLDQTLRLVDGENLYDNDFSNPPYTISNYPPVFLLLQAPFAKIFGPAFWYGRGISMVSALLTALLIGLTLYTLTGSWLASVAGGLMLLAFPYIQFWSLLNRIDSLALALSWAGIFVAIRYNERRWGIPVAAALLILSIYTRQSYALAAPAGVFFWLVVTRRFRKALHLTLLVGGVGLGLFLLINLLTAGGFFLNIVTANVNPFIWDTVRHYANELGDNAAYLLALIGFYVILERFFPHTQAWPLVLPYLVAATLSAITVGKDGSNVNYLFELAAALSLGAGAAFDWFSRRSAWLGALAAAVLAVQVMILVGWNTEDMNGRIQEKIDQEQQIARLFEVVKSTEGIILTDEYMGLVPLAGKRIYFQPFEYKMLSEGGVWDQMPFVASIVSKEFGAVLWYAPPTWSSIDARWTPRMQDAIRSSYKQEKTEANTFIMRPRE